MRLKEIERIESRSKKINEVQDLPKTKKKVPGANPDGARSPVRVRK
jgi:hypothetical protein